MAKYSHKPKPHSGSWSGETYCIHEDVVKYGRPRKCMVSLKKHPDGTWQHAPELDDN